MKHILFFITHKTLTLDHAELTLYSISKQASNHKFDELVIYNTHKDELPDTQIMQLCAKYSVGRFFKEIKFFTDYPEQKSLGADVHAISVYTCNNYKKEDRILLLKSDSLLSKNYFDEVFNLPIDRPVYFVAPFICAKQRVPDEEILEYISRDKFIRSDDITFFVEDQSNSGDNDFNNRPGVNVTDHQIKFTSCYVITDFSCHLISVGLLEKMTLTHQSWGGAKFYHLIPHFIGTDRCFVVHKFHNIISENRSTDREGPVKDWLAS